MCFAPKVSMPKVETPATPAEPIRDDPAPVSYGTSPSEDKEKSGTASLKVEKSPMKPMKPMKPMSTKAKPTNRISSKFGMNKTRK